MTLDDQRGDIIKHLEQLNANIEKQNSIRHILLTGVIYGIGWVIGSAIIATIVLGIVGPLFGKLPWVHEIFRAGSEITR